MKCLTILFAFGMVATTLAMPTAKEMSVAEPKVKTIMSGFKTFGESEQASMAMKASEVAKTEAEKFLLLQGAFRKYLKAKDYGNASKALSAIEANVKDVPETYVRAQLEKAMKDLPVGVGAELTEIKTALDEGRPRILSITPANGDMQVDVDTKEIVVKFDRPMDGGMSLCGKMCPKPTAKPSFDESKKVLTYPVALAKGQAYTILFNTKQHTGFKSREGVVLNPVVYAFKVK